MIGGNQKWYCTKYSHDNKGNERSWKSMPSAQTYVKNQRKREDGKTTYGRKRKYRDHDINGHKQYNKDGTIGCSLCKKVYKNVPAYYQHTCKK
eukprot:488000_1